MRMKIMYPFVIGHGGWLDIPAAAVYSFDTKSAKGSGRMNAYEKEHNELMRRLGAECAVLLKSDGSFPLEAPCRLALYGSGARRTVKGGTGSGEVNSRTFVTAEDGLALAGFEITTGSWLDGYDTIRDKAKKSFVRSLKRSALKHGTLAIIESMGAVMPEPEYELPLGAEGEAAVYVLSRISGEGSDRKPVPGDILLTETEIRDITALEGSFDKFLLVLNVGGPVDLSPVMNVGNILLLSQLGCETGSVLADIILGKSTPSGKLASTWSAWEARPQIGEFGGRFDTRYNEGIYVGWRAFESLGIKPLFPFGYGLSYTDFSLRPAGIAVKDGRVSVRVSVKNTGARNGSEVVQLYVSQPAGRLGKPPKVLCAFDKTEELAPGAEQELELRFDLRDMASFDTERAAWILEAGDHVLMMGDSSADTAPCCVIRLDGEAIIKKVKNCFGKPDFNDWYPAAVTEAVPEGLPVIRISAAEFETETVEYERSDEIDPVARTLSEEELCYVNIGAFRQRGAGSVIGDAGRSVAGAAGETTGRFKDRGIPQLVMADGPAGLRLSRRYFRDKKGVHGVDGGMPDSMLELMPAPAAFIMRLMKGGGKPKGEIFEQNCTAIPIGSALAQSWNLRLAESCGDIVGDEMERFGVHLWLAPALNIHRDIRCGRNFEYYSEDPLISGKIAAAVTRGVQKHPGCGVTLKHFAANNQETNRYGSNSAVSERALREIYLKGFEIAVREGAPHAIMTSYNLINGVHTSERRDLIEDVLRCEFGFDGVVMTDWIVAMLNTGKNKYRAPNAALIAAAGGDLVMPGGKADLKAMRAGIKDGALTVRRLMINASRVIRLAKKLNGE